MKHDIITQKQFVYCKTIVTCSMATHPSHIPPPLSPHTHPSQVQAATEAIIEKSNAPHPIAIDSFLQLLQATFCANHCQWCGSMYATHGCCKWTPI